MGAQNVSGLAQILGGENTNCAQSLFKWHTTSVELVALVAHRSVSGISGISGISGTQIFSISTVH